jgi:hypothetical protein
VLQKAVKGKLSYFWAKSGTEFVSPTADIVVAIVKLGV